MQHLIVRSLLYPVATAVIPSRNASLSLPGCVDLVELLLVALRHASIERNRKEAKREEEQSGHDV